MATPRGQIRWNGWGWTARQDRLAGREDFWRWLAGEMGMPALLATPPQLLDDISLPMPRLTAAQLAAFAAIVGNERICRDNHERAFHARGRSYGDLLRLRDGDLSTVPDAVLYPRGEEEVLAILKLATAEKIAIIPFGGGTGAEDGVTAWPGAITLDMSGINRLLSLDALSGIAIVEAGITGFALERALGAKGFTLGRACDEFSNLGGWIAEQGVTNRANAEDWLVGVRLATTSGILEIGDATVKGPNLKHLLAGSQGKLGIVTQLSVRVRQLRPLLSCAWQFHDFAAASAALRQTVQAGISPYSMRLSDGEEIRFLRVLEAPEIWCRLAARLEDLSFGAMPLHGAIVTAVFAEEDSLRRFSAHASDCGGRRIRQSWQQQGLFPVPYLRDFLLDRGVGVETVSMPASWSALPALYPSMKSALERILCEGPPVAGGRGLVLAHLDEPHGGGANLIFSCLFPRHLDDPIPQAQAIRRAANSALLSAGGIVLKEDGAHLDAPSLAAMRAAKALCDPAGILNPRQGVF